MKLEELDLDGAIILRGFCDAIEEHVISSAITGLIDAFVMDGVARAVGAVNPDEEGFYPFRARASMPTLDIDKLVFVPENFADGMHLFRANPVILHNHDANKAIGYAPEVEIRAESVEIMRGLIDDTPGSYAAAVAHNIRRRIERGISIGVKPMEDPKFLKDGRILFGKVQLKELSVTPVPANMGALIGKYAQDLMERAQSGSKSAAEDLTAEVVADLLSDQRAKVDAYFDGKRAEFDAYIEEQTRGLEKRMAEAIELRLGSVADLVERAVEKRAEAEMVADALRSVTRAKPSVEGGGQGGGGAPSPPPPSTPRPAYPADGFGGKQGAAPVGGDSKAPFIEGALVPKETPPDPKDGHRHKVYLRDDGTGETNVVRGSGVLQHMHPVSGWVVVPVEVAGVMSEHPGSLYPGQSLSTTAIDLNAFISSTFQHALVPWEYHEGANGNGEGSPSD